MKKYYLSTLTCMSMLLFSANAKQRGPQNVSKSVAQESVVASQTVNANCGIQTPQVPAMLASTRTYIYLRNPGSIVYTAPHDMIVRLRVFQGDVHHFHTVYSDAGIVTPGFEAVERLAPVSQLGYFNPVTNSWEGAADASPWFNLPAGHSVLAAARFEPSGFPEPPAFGKKCASGIVILERYVAP